MRQVGMVVMALLVLSTGATAHRRAGTPTERLPGLTRWMALTAPNADLVGTAFPTPYSVDPYADVSITVDSAGAVHAVQTGPTGLLYMNNWYESRRANGFSEPLMISTSAQGFTLPKYPRIACGPDDALHVVWMQMEVINGYNSLFYAKKDVGGWSLPTALIPPTGLTFIGKPMVAVGKDGVLHIAAAAGGGIVHFTQFASEIIPGSPVVSACAIATGPSGQVAVGWNGGACVKTGTTWGPVLPLATDGDLAFDSTGALHTTWSTANAIYYSNNGGATQTIPTNQPANWSPRIVVDSRDQVHVLYTSTVGLSYAARVRNPDPAVVSTTWSTSYAAALPGAGIVAPVTQAFITPTDVIHVACGPYYTRTMDYGTGARDPGAFEQVLPGAAVNVANGNLMAAVKVFTTTGFGPPQQAILTYNGQSDENGYVGRGWRFGFETYLVDHWSWLYSPTQSPTGQPKEIVTVFLGDGRPIVFRYNSTYHALLPEDEYGFSARMERTSWDSLATEYKLYAKDGSVMTFNSSGKLSQVTSPTGLSISMNYDDKGRLTHMFDNVGFGGGRTSQYTYETVTSKLYAPRITQVKDVANNRVDLGYSGRFLTYVRYLDTLNTPAYSFDYGLANDSVNQDRYGKLKLFRTPNGTVGNYGYALRYLQDGRVVRVDDPSAPYLLDTEADTVAPTARVAKVSFAYDETIALGQARKVTMTDRRNFKTEFRSEFQRTLVTQIRDQASLNSVPGVTPAIRTFDTFGNLTNIQDRWGNNTTFTYHAAGTPAYVRDNLKEVFRPKPGSAGQDLVASMTYTNDGFNNVATRSLYVSPPAETGSTALNALQPVSPSAGVAATENYTYNAKGQLTQADFPSTTQADGSTQPPAQVKIANNGPWGQPTSVTDENGNTTTMSNFSSASGLPMTTTLPSGAFEDMEPDLYGRIARCGKAMECPGMTITRDQMDRITKTQDPRGRATNYASDPDGNITSVTPPAGGPMTFTYDKRGNPTGGTGPDGSWSSVPDATGNVSRFVDVRGNATNADFDYAGRMSELRVPGGSSTTGGGGGPATHRVQYNYDGFDGTNHFATKTVVGTPTNRVSTEIYDKRGRPVRSLEADGQLSEERFYDELDRLVSTQTKVGTTLQTAMIQFRDQRGRTTRVKVQDQPYGKTATASFSTWAFYNPGGSPLKIVDPLGTPNSGTFAHSTTFVWDTSDRLKQVIDGKGVVVRDYSYDIVNNVTEVLWPAPETKGTQLVRLYQNQYNTFHSHQVTHVYDRNWNLVSYQYDPLSDKITQVTDPDNISTTYTYDSLTRRLDEVIQAQGTADESRLKHFWANGMLSEIRRWNPQTSAYDASHRYSYDKAGRLEKVESPLMATKQFFYNDFGDLSQTVEGTKTINHTYNSLGLPLTSTWSGAWTGSLTRTYTGLGQLQSVTDGSTTRGMTYDSWKGTPKDETFTVGASLWKFQTHSYDGSGTRTGYVDAEGKSHVWTMDDNSRPIEYRYNNILAAAMTWTPGGLPSTMTKYNAAGTATTKTVYTYDIVGNLIETETNSLITGAVVAHTFYTYSPAGRRTKVFHEHLNVTYELTYDGRGQLKTQNITGNGGGATPPPITWSYGANFPSFTGLEGTATPDTMAVPANATPIADRNASYVWDKAGNRSSQTVNGALTTFAYNAANQLTTETWASKSVSHQYDSWGNETLRTTTGTGAKTETYGYNSLGLLSSYTNSAPAANWQYAHWPTGDRYSKTNVTANTSELYTSAEDDVVTDYTKNSGGTISLQNTYLQGLDLDSKLTKVPASGGRKQYVSDQVGTNLRTLDDSGVALETPVRDVWGELLGGSTTDRYGFAQREHDSESGLVYVRNRLYDPTTGRFTQNDPIFWNEPSSHYTYAENDPLQLVDPMGLESRWAKVGRGFTNAAAEPFRMGRDILVGSWALVTRTPLEKVNFWSGASQATQARILNGQDWNSAIYAGLNQFALNLTTFGIAGMSENMMDMIMAYACGDNEAGDDIFFEAIGQFGFDLFSAGLMKGAGALRNRLHSKFPPSKVASRNSSVGAAAVNSDEFGPGYRVGDPAPSPLRADPREIRFTQPTVSQNFSDGHTIQGTTEALRSGQLAPRDLPTIRVVEFEGQSYTLDNRRLVAFQNAGETQIPVQRVSLADPAIAAEFKSKYNPINGGKNIVITENAKGRGAAKAVLRQYGKIR